MESDSLTTYFCAWVYFNPADGMGLCPPVWYDAWATCSSSPAGAYVNCAYVSGDDNPDCFTNDAGFGPHPLGTLYSFVNSFDNYLQVNSVF